MDKLDFFILVFIICMFFYCHNSGGWYCDNCHKGTHRVMKYHSVEKYGDIPCEASPDSCHHFSFYLFTNPNKKYVK